MGIKTKDPAGHPHPPERFAPGNCIGFSTSVEGQRIRSENPPANEPINPFFHIDQRLLHYDAAYHYASGEARHR